MTTPRRNRIIDHRTVKGRDLLPNPANWRTHPPQQRAATTAALDLLGYVDELKVVATDEGFLLLDGHLRAQIGEDDDIPVAVVDLDPDEQRIFLATYDPLAAMAITDHAAYDALTDVVATEDETLMRLLEGVRQHDRPLLLAQRPERDAEVTGSALEKVEAEDYKPFTSRGQVWQLGEHRLMCGDATSAEDVATLLDGEKPLLTVTDPPYGVGYQGGANNEKKRESLVGDEDTTLYQRAMPFSPSDVLYLWHGGTKAEDVYRAVRESGWSVRAQIIWSKLNAHFGAFTAHYLQAHEPLLYCVRRDAHWVGPTNERTIWEIAQPSHNELHLTQKPLECMEHPISNHQGDVYDPFVGSGTTIIAAENLGRRCYAMDIEPRYCDVAIRRWEAYTGGKAELLE